MLNRTKVRRTLALSTAALLSQHTQLLQCYGAESAAVYEFEMRHLDNADFLQRAVEQKRRHIQWRQDRVFYRWCWLLVIALVLLQICSILFIIYGRLLH